MAYRMLFSSYILQGKVRDVGGGQETIQGSVISCYYAGACLNLCVTCFDTENRLREMLNVFYGQETIINIIAVYGVDHARAIEGKIIYFIPDAAQGGILNAWHENGKQLV